MYVIKNFKLETCAQEAGSLCANGQICCSSPSNTAAAQRLQRMRACDSWEFFLGEDHTSLGRDQRVHAHLRECCEPVVDDQEEVFEVWGAFGRW
jgi:hypothetical protein